MGEPLDLRPDQQERLARHEQNVLYFTRLTSIYVTPVAGVVVLLGIGVGDLMASTIPGWTYMLKFATFLTGATGIGAGMRLYRSRQG